MPTATRGWYGGQPADALETPAFPKRLARASSSSSQTTITTVVDLTGLSIDFVVTSTYRVKVRLCVPIVYGSTAATVSQLNLTDGANTITSFATMAAGEVNGGGILVVEEEISIPGLYSRKGRLLVNSGGGNTNTLLDPAALAFIEATEFAV